MRDCQTHVRHKLLRILDELREIPFDAVTQLYNELPDDTYEDYLLYLLIQAATFERFQLMQLEEIYSQPAYERLSNFDNRESKR